MITVQCFLTVVLCCIKSDACCGFSFSVIKCLLRPIKKNKEMLQKLRNKGRKWKLKREKASKSDRGRQKKEERND